MIKQRAFFYKHHNNPGLGILAVHEYEGWQRANFYAFGVDMDALHKGIQESCEDALLQEGAIASRPAQSKVIIAGGVVFKNMSVMAGQGVEATGILDTLEKRVPGFAVVDVSGMERAESLNPLDVFCFTYGKKVIGVSRVVFFEYATQMSFVGVYRDQDGNLVNELFSELSKLHEYMTTPKPLRTDEKDDRVGVNMFMIRHPLKEELQGDFVQAILKVPGITFYAV